MSQYTIQLAWMRRLILKCFKSPVWHCKHCHLTIQSNTVSSFCVQVNACKRQQVSRISKGLFKVRLWKAMGIIFWSLRFTVLCSHETGGKYDTVIESNNAADLFAKYVSWPKRTSRALICYKLTLAASRKRRFIRSCRCKPPKANMNSKAMFWAGPCLWLLICLEPIFTWQIQWSEMVLKRQEVRKLLLWKGCSHHALPW